MEPRRTMTMNWDGLGDLDDDEELFFDAQRLSAVSPQDLASSSSDEEFDDSRMSFSSSADYSNFSEFQTSEYDMWMAAPESITDRRRRLLQDMGLGSNKDLLGGFGGTTTPILSGKTDIPPPVEKELSDASVKPKDDDKLGAHQPCESGDGLPGSQGILVRSRSDGGLDAFYTDTKIRNEEMIGSVSKQSLTRTPSGFSTPFVGLSSQSEGQQRRIFVASNNENNLTSKCQKESILLIKNLDNGNEFMVKECHNEGNWNKLSDVQTGKQITMEEFEKNVGHSPKVKELMRKSENGDRKILTANNLSFKQSFQKSKKRGAALFKNIKLGSIGASKTDKQRAPTITNSPSVNSTNSNSSTTEQKPSSQWVKARVHGKPYKEFTALHLSQEIQGHDGSIWAMKFTYDGHYLATAGEDKLIHIWEVQECDVMTMRNADDLGSVSGTPVHPMAMMASPDGRPPLPDSTPDQKKKKGKKKKGIPDYVHEPETVFGLSEKPVCTLTGHQDDILDLSWSRSRLLLSSSMDKTVKLWDIETKNCLKVFSHSDYVTCIQFNPADDDYFISGSLDSKVRIWNIPDRHVVDWLDLHEMVTAVGYSNDGKVSVVGTHKGICRFYNTADFKLEFKEQIELKTSKKPQPKKITGFQFSSSNPSEVLVTSADSRVRILDGAKLVQKYKGYKNNNSQFKAGYSPDGKYIISASEDSHVCIWRHEETRGKHKHPIITSYENFPCKEVSVTAPWPGITKLQQPLVAMHSKKNAKKSTPTLPTQSPSPSPSPGFSPTRDDISNSKPSSSPLPPLPKSGNPSMESIEYTDHHSQTDSSVGPCESFNSANGSSGRFDEMTSPSPSPSPSTNLKSPLGGNHGHKTIQATAWGFVIVTAGLGGEIKVFQNVGLPFKVGRL